MSKEQYQQQQQWGGRGGYSGRSRGRGGGETIIQLSSVILHSSVLMYALYAYCKYFFQLSFNLMA